MMLCYLSSDRLEVYSIYGLFGEPVLLRYLEVSTELNCLLGQFTQMTAMPVALTTAG